MGQQSCLILNCFIYYFEDNEIYADRLEEIFTRIQDGKLKANMSVLSILELLVRPKKEGNIFLENRYKLALMNYPNLKIINVSVEVSDIAAGLRAVHRIKTPDAIILATALYIKVDGFVTNDTRLKSVCESEGIALIGLDA